VLDQERKKILAQLEKERESDPGQAQVDDAEAGEGDDDVAPPVVDSEYERMKRIVEGKNEQVKIDIVYLYQLEEVRCCLWSRKLVFLKESRIEFIAIKLFTTGKTLFLITHKRTTLRKSEFLGT
jgi:hypothetical protein